MTVPFSEAVVRRVPVLFRARAEMGALCARMICETVRDLVKKSRTSPDAALAEEGWAGAACGEMAAIGAGGGTGEGYARYELLAEGERATMASGLGVVSIMC